MKHRHPFIGVCSIMAHDANGHEGLITPIIDAKVGPFPLDAGVGICSSATTGLKVE